MTLLKFGPHHDFGGGALTEKWLPHARIAKFVGDLGLSSLAPSGCLTIGRLLDDGLMPGGQGFDVNRFSAANDSPADIVDVYLRDVWGVGTSQDKIALNPGLRAIEFANEQHPLGTREMAWWGEACYQFSSRIKSYGLSNNRPLQAIIGSWSVGTPSEDLMPHWGKAAQACTDFEAILSIHGYAALNNFCAYRYRRFHSALAALGYAGMKWVSTESGAEGACSMVPWNSPDSPFRGRLDLYWIQYLTPLLNGWYDDENFVGGVLFAVGGGWLEHDVSQALTPDGRDLVDLLVTYMPPIVEPPPPAYPRLMTVKGTIGSNLRFEPFGTIVGAAWTGRQVLALREHNEHVELSVWVHKSRVV